MPPESSLHSQAHPQAQTDDDNDDDNMPDSPTRARLRLFLARATRHLVSIHARPLSRPMLISLPFSTLARLFPPLQRQAQLETPPRSQQQSQPLQPQVQPPRPPQDETE